MTVLRRGYVPVEPNTDGFDDKLKEQFRKQDPGGKAGKQLGGQLNRALKRLNLDPIDVKADPKAALAAIKLAEQQLRDLSGDAATVEMKVQTEKALRELSRFRRQVGDLGEDSGKEFGGQLNQALAGLDVKTIDFTADPKSALKAIDDTEARLRELSRNSATVEVKLRTEQALSQLGRFKKELGDIGDEQGETAATGFAARFGARIGPLIANVAASPPVAVGGGLIAAAMAPTILAGISGAIVGGAGIGGVIGGVTLAARDERVKSAGKVLGRSLLADLEHRSSDFVPAVLGGIGQVRAGFAEMGPDLDRIFKSSRFVAPLTEGLLKGVKGFVAGFADAIDQADPVIASLSNAIGQIGTATGDLFSDMSRDAEQGAGAIDQATFAITNFIAATGGIVHAGAVVSGYTDVIDKAVDRTRYFIEDNGILSDGLRDLGVTLDLTADGFTAGTAEAEAYRRATMGTATAADFATLKTAGMGDSQILAADASGKYRLELVKAKAALFDVAAANTLLVASEDQVTEAQKASSKAQEEYTQVLDQLNPRQTRATMLADGLRKATTSLHGAQIAATDANEEYQSSWDDLSEAVKTNKSTLDIHTKAGRGNRDSLQSLLTSTNELYFAEINTGTSIANATKKHNDRIVAIKEEAHRLGLDKTATQKLIDTYGKIPGKKQTKLVIDGVDAVVKALRDLYVFQRSLADGIPIASEIAKLKGESGPAKKYGGYRDGGRTAKVAEDQAAGVVHGKEFVFNAPTVRRIDRQQPGFLDEVHATGQLPGYAGGGFVAPVDTSTRWPFKTNAANTRVPTKAQAAAKITPAFTSGDWPSSPGAQRGDSGVWHKVVQLIKSTGPLSGSFGNSYRPGDPLWHGSGRAVDWMGYNQDSLATFLANRKPLELIHRTKQRDYAYTRGRNKGSFRESLMEAHRNHIHIAMAGGGVIGEPVIGTGLTSGKSYSFGERGPETVTPGVGGAGGNTFNITVNVPVGAHPAETGRQVVESIKAYEQRNGSRWRS